MGKNKKKKKNKGYADFEEYEIRDSFDEDDDKDVVVQLQRAYFEMGTDETTSIQKAMTTFIHDRVMEVGKFTMAELGYLHACSLTGDKKTGAIDLCVYFDAALATRKVVNPVNGKTMYRPVNELNIFANYLFTGDIMKCVTLENMLTPRVAGNTDRAGRMAISISDKKKTDYRAVLVLHCNVALTVASILGINLLDPNFTVRCKTIQPKNVSPDDIVTDEQNTTVPVGVYVTWNGANESNWFDPADAEAYVALQNASTSERKDLEKDFQKKLKKKSEKEGVKAVASNRYVFDKLT